MTSPMIILVLIAAGSRDPDRSAERATSQAPRCGQLREWSMPEDSRVNGSDSERTFALLVTQARISTIAVAAEAYCRRHGQYPSQFADIQLSTMSTLLNEPRASARCLVVREELNDGWGRPIFLDRIRGSLVVRSAGPDGIFTTSDDVALPTEKDSLSRDLVLPPACG